jgi:ribonuclease P/MRP protein subunit RPP40
MLALPTAKSLGVWLSPDLKPTTHCRKIFNTAVGRMGVVRRVFRSGDVSILSWAFKVYVRPILEYASPVWSPWLLHDIDLIELVQRRFTKRLPGMYHLPYPERLRKLNLDSLELRRLKADLVLTFKLLKGHTKLNLPLFDLSTMKNTRGHSLKLIHQPSALNARHHFFAVRIVPPWNALPERAISCQSVDAFRAELNRLDLRKFVFRPEFVVHRSV